jgi:hypothetical protein
MKGEEMIVVTTPTGHIRSQIVANLLAANEAVPDDIGPMIVALLSEENRWVNGPRIEVSGGMAL